MIRWKDGQRRAVALIQAEGKRTPAPHCCPATNITVSQAWQARAITSISCSGRVEALAIDPVGCFSFGQPLLRIPSARALFLLSFSHRFRYAFRAEPFRQNSQRATTDQKHPCVPSRRRTKAVSLRSQVLFWSTIALG